MRTYLFEGQMTAMTSLAHNGGQSFGINSKLRREKVVQPDGTVVEVPVISGNGLRGMLRDRGMLHLCAALGYGVDHETGEVRGLPLPAFYLLFSGGSLTEGWQGMDIDRARTLRDLVPLLGVFGGAVGNLILPGKLQVGKAMPIALETRHLLPEAYAARAVASVWDYCQEEMYTRKDDAKHEHYQPLLASPEQLTADALMETRVAQGTPQQMLYYVETLAAGTPLYWRITLEDPTEVEFEAFLTTLAVWSKQPTVGGKSAVGLGQVAVSFDRWMEINPRSTTGEEVARPLGQAYQRHLETQRDAIRRMLEGMTA